MTTRHTPVVLEGDNGEHVLDIGEVDATIGNVIEATTADPVIDTGELRFHIVIVNMTLARQPHGANCIRVDLPEDGKITAAEAHQLGIDLEAARDTVARIRGDHGYDT